MIIINHIFQWEWLSGWKNVPSYFFNMSQRWNQYRPSRTCLYLCTSDIWICWFGRFAFVKPSGQQTSDINASFVASLDFSQKNCGFSNSNHLHLQSGDLSTFVRVCCFLHCSSIGIHLSNPFSLSPSYSVMNGDGKKYLVMDGDVKRDGASPDFSQKEIVFSNSNHLHLQTGDIHICQTTFRTQTSPK